MEENIEYYKKGSRYLREGINVLHLQGSHYEMGYQHGVLLKEEIKKGAFKYFGDILEGLIEKSFLARLPKFFSDLSLQYLDKVIISRLVKGLPKECLEEIRGLADGAELDFNAAQKSFVFPDVTSYLIGRINRRHKVLNLPLRLRIPTLGCSSFVALGEATVSGKLIHGRNMDFYGIGFWDPYHTVIYYQPSEGLSYVSISSAGVATAGLTSMNEKGITVDLHQNYSSDISLDQTPIMALGNKIAQEADSLEKALAIIKQNPPNAGWTLIISDGQKGDVVVVELSAHKMQVRKPRKGFIYAANSYMTKELRETELELNRGITINSLSRHKRLGELLELNFGKINEDIAAQIMGDHFDLNVRRERAIGDIVVQLLNLSSTILSPEEKKFWVAKGRAPVCNSKFVGFHFEDGFEKIKNSKALEGNEFNKTGKFYSLAEIIKSESFFQKGNLQKALTHLERAIKHNLEEPIFYHLKGMIHLKMRTFEDAVGCFDQALTFSQHNYKEGLEYLWKGRAYDLLNNRERAVDEYKKILKLNCLSRPLLRLAEKGIKRPYLEKNLDFINLEFFLGEEMDLK